MPKYIGVILFLCLTILFVGCDRKSEEIVPEIVPTETLMMLEPTTAPTVTPEPTLQPTQPPINVTVTVEEKNNWVMSNETGEYLGQVITVRVELSHCSYRANVNGSPTFCNDQPYPEHTFTYLVWGKDWSHFDQTCVLVTGEIVEYDGKTQIVVEEEGQVVPCDE